MKKWITILLAMMMCFPIALAATFQDTIFLATTSQTKVTVGLDPIYATNVTVTTTSVIFTDLNTTQYLVDSDAGTILKQFDGSTQNYTVTGNNKNYVFQAAPPTSSKEAVCSNALSTFPNFGPFLIIAALAVVLFVILGAVAFMRNTLSGNGSVEGFDFKTFIMGVAALGVAIVVIGVFAALTSNVCV